VVVLQPGQQLVQQGRYVATVDVPFLLGALVSPALLKSKLEEKGFTGVSVSESKPAGFPLPGLADYYVAVSWNRTPQVFDVPDAVTSHRKIA
jgi:hypothetical protein